MLERRQSARVDSLLDDPEVDQDEARAARRPHRAVRRRSIARGARDRDHRRPRQAERERAVHRRRPSARRDLRRARRGRGRAVGTRRARHRAPRRSTAQEERTPAPRARAARRDRPGADVDPARPEGDSAARRARRTPSVPRRTSARSSSRRCRTCARSRSSCGPSALDDFGLGPALERLAADVRGAERHRDDRRGAASSERLPPEIETTLYRVVQEALTNVVKHAGAEHVSIVISQRRPSVAATIDDDGRGFRRGRGPRRRARPRRDARAPRARGRHARDRVDAGSRDDRSPLRCRSTAS